jgi:hypothetical protein
LAAKSGDLAAEVVRNAQRIVSLEIALAKQKVKDLAVANAIAAGMVAFGGLLVILSVLVAVPSLVVTLVQWHLQAAAVWVLLYALLGIGLVLFGKTRFALKLPAKTLASLEGEQRMGPAADEIDRQIRETRDSMNENIGVLEQRAASKAVRYGRIIAGTLGLAVVAGAGVLIYRRMNQPSRREQLQRRLIDALKDLPDSVRDLPDEVTARLKKPLPSVKVVINGEDQATEPGTLGSIVRKVAPAVVGTASTALIRRFTRPPDLTGGRPSRSAIPSYD